MIGISNTLLISHYLRPDGQKEWKKFKSDLVKTLPIKKQNKNDWKDNQYEVLEANIVPTSGKPKSQRKLIFSIQDKGNILQGKMLTNEFLAVPIYA